jgi:hypothetical protein
MPPIFTTTEQKKNSAGEARKKNRNKRPSRGTLWMWNVGGKLVGAVSTIADIHMIIIQVLCSELYKTNFQPSSSSSFYCHRGLSVWRRRRDGLEGARRWGVTAARTVQTWMLKVFTRLDGVLFPPSTHTSTERWLTNDSSTLSLNYPHHVSKN